MLAPETSADRISVGGAFLVNSNFPSFAKWGISPKAVPLLLPAKTVLSPSDTQRFTGWINGQLFQKHIELPQSGSRFFFFFFLFSAFNKNPRDLNKNRKNKKTNSIMIFVKGREIISQPALLLLHSPRKVLRAEAISLSGGA